MNSQIMRSGANRRLSSLTTQAGHTLIELLASVTILGILIGYLATMGSESNASEERSIEAENALNGRLIVDGLYSYASTKFANGVLPAPYSGNGYVATVYNPSDASNSGSALSQAIASTGVPPSKINDDGSSGANVRVYQLVSGLTYSTPLEMTNGPLVNLTYQYGVIYQTKCRKADTSCNPGSSGVPGQSPVLTASNYRNYQISGTDSNLVTVSSLRVQTAMLITTRTNLNLVQDALLNDFKTRQIMAAAGDATNFYPAASTTKAGQNPAANQGCRDGWYSLSASDLLAQIQQSSQVYGSTAWGGDIEFCRDYDPLGAKSADAPPHKAALRINSNVSLGIAPDSVVPGNNVVLTF